MKYLFFLVVLLVNASLFSCGQNIKPRKSKFGLLNQSRVGRGAIQFEKPRVGRSEPSPKFDPIFVQRYEEPYEVDIESDLNNGRIPKSEGNYLDSLSPPYYPWYPQWEVVEVRHP